MKRAGLQEKSSLGVEGSVECDGAVAALRSFPYQEAVKGANSELTPEIAIGNPT
jgi:hypothetical protein